MGNPHLRDRVAVATARLAAVVLRRVLHRGASALPGRIAWRIAPTLLGRALSALPLVVVTGSSGKSTTTKMLTAIVRAHGRSVFTNPSTANLRQGVLSAVIDQADAMGCLSADVAIVELDEGAAAALAPQLQPELVVLTNVSAEQLDRFHSAERVAGLLADVARRAAGVVAGADDVRLRRLARALEAPVSFFGLSAPTGTRVDTVAGREAELTIDGTRLQVRLPASGLHYALDAAAALETARRLLGPAFDPARAADALDTLDPVFGRGEVVSIGGQRVELVLVQNPDSMARNLAELGSPSRLLVAIGSDVRDPSWLWRVDTARLGGVDLVSGSRAYDIATRLAYDDVPVAAVEPDLQTAVGRLLALPPGDGPTAIVFSADAMRRVRRAYGLDRAA